MHVCKMMKNGHDLLVSCYSTFTPRTNKLDFESYTIWLINISKSCTILSAHLRILRLILFPHDARYSCAKQPEYFFYEYFTFPFGVPYGVECPFQISLISAFIFPFNIDMTSQYPKFWIPFDVRWFFTTINAFIFLSRSAHILYISVVQCPYSFRTMMIAFTPNLDILSAFILWARAF